ncbi:MAG: autotransporter-associated beta strand repeat-containing protein [Tepidisphaeraceae bacterium]
MRMNRSSRRSLLALLAAAAVGVSAHELKAAAYTWDGGDGTNPNLSEPTNWSTDAKPAATGDTIAFAGTANLNPVNDYITSLTSTSITFASGAGSFNLGGNSITVGNTGGNDNFVTKVSTNDQTISAPINLAGGGRDRSIIMTGGGKLTLSGNINFNNDWLFPNTTAGTIVLSGNNSGDGKGSVVVAGTNTSRAVLRNNVAGTTLVLGSDTALGNAGTGDVSLGTAAFKGMVANQNMTITTSGGNRDLSGRSIIVNAANVSFAGTNDLTISSILNQGGNRDFWVTSSGSVTVNDAICTSIDQTGRNLYVNLTGTGSMTVNGKLYDTFHSSGLTAGQQGTFRKAGIGTMNLNGDNASFNGLITVEGGTLKLGHANALGATGSTKGTTVGVAGSAATLDLNGVTTGETVSFNTAGDVLANSSASASALTTDATVNGDLTVNAAGNIATARLIASTTRLVTKQGNGMLTTAGNNHNNLIGWDIQAGTVVFANTAGFAADRGTTVSGGTLRLSGSNSDLINDGGAFTMSGGTFDLNGKAEAVAAIAGTGGTVTNSAAGTATLFVGGGSGGSSSNTYGGVIQSGAGVLNLTKEGTGTQTLTAANTYTGNTTITNGILALTGSASIASSPVITIAGSIANAGTAKFDVSGLTNTFTLGPTQTLKGYGTLAGAVAIAGVVAPGGSIGTLSVTGDVDFNAGSTYLAELDTSTLTSDVLSITGNFNVSGASALSLTDVAAMPATLNVGDRLTLLTYTGTWNGGTFSGLSNGGTFTLGSNLYTIAYNDSVAGVPAVTLTATAVPEPMSALGVIALGSIVLMRRHSVC